MFICFPNVIFQRLLGYSVEEINSKTVFEFFVRRIQRRSIIEQVKANNSFSHQTINMYNKDGHPIHFKILSHQNQRNDIITLKLLDIT